MGISGNVQLGSLLYACGLGFWLGLYYELFRTLRLLLPPTAKSCFFQDVFFCLSAAITTFFCFLAIADGRLLPYLFVGEIIGFFAFYFTVGLIFHQLLAVFLRILFRISRTVGRWISRPVKAAFRWLFALLQPLISSIWKKTADFFKKKIFFRKKS